MPPGTRCMFKDQFVRARYILKGLSEGRAMPPNFPEHVFKERFPLPRFGSRLAETFGAPTAPPVASAGPALTHPSSQAPRRSRFGTTFLRTLCVRSWKRSTARAGSFTAKPRRWPCCAPPTGAHSRRALEAPSWSASC